MPLILNIDTSSENASICLALDGGVTALQQNAEQKDHAGWIHSAIETLLKQVECTLQDLNAVAITSGPGSYTGLRVGMSTAKGLCYALNIPLITENTLRVLALATKQAIKDDLRTKKTLLCPMLDARRMEVFTALFDEDLHEVLKSCALVLDEQTFAQYFDNSSIVFSGNGSKKFQQLIINVQATFLEVSYSAAHLAILSNNKFLRKELDDIAYAEPLYLKEFYTLSKK